LISRAGIVPISSTQDTAGPMTRTVMEAGLLLAAMKGGVSQDYVGGMRRDALRGKRIGALKFRKGANAAVDAAFNDAVAALRAGGAEVVEPVEIATEGQWEAHEFEVLLYEFKDGMDRFLTEVGAPVGSLAGLIAWNTAHSQEVLRWFGQELLEQALAKGGLDSPGYLEARAAARRLAWDEGLGATLAKHKLDAVIVPTMGGPAWPIDPVLGDRFVGAGYGVAAVAGTPSLTVPMGEDHGLPLGLAFLGAPDSEAELLAIGYAFEQATRARRSPTYIERLE
jgi:amidase